MKNTNYTMYLDDIRIPKTKFNVIIRSYEEAVDYISQHGIPTYISFDHDLGINSDNSLTKSGYDLAKWIVESVMENSLSFPKNFDFNVHSANPIGKHNIESLLNNYLLFKVKYDK